jgi:DNA polymerase III subunit epsilon
MRLRWRPQGAAASFARAGRTSGKQPWRAARWCALDLELTGLDPRTDGIIAIGAVPIEDGRVILGESIYTLVRTTKRSEHGAILAHKLRVEDLAQAPVLDDAIDQILDVLAGRVPVFHAAWIERNFLSPVFAQRRLRLPAAADTEVLGRMWLRQRDGVAPPGLPLAKLAQELGQEPEVPHHALGDALTTARAFIALASHLDAVMPQTVGMLLTAHEHLRRAWRFG